MRLLVDTNVLCRLAEKGHALHSTAKEAVTRLNDQGHELCLVPQVLYEYWVVATRPASENGLDMAASEVDTAIHLWLDVFTLLRDERGIFSVWRDLTRKYSIKGKNAHDARLVAAMLRHGLQQLLTFNVADFQRYHEIELVDVRSVAKV